MSNIEKFLKAVTITDTKYYPGACKWQDYLVNGEVNYFTSTGGARDLMVDVDHEQLKEELTNLAIKKICEYYGNILSNTTTHNKTLNEIVVNINLIRQLSDPIEEYNIISDYLLSPTAIIDTIEILKGHIKGNDKEATTLSVNEDVHSYLNELMEFKKNINNKKDEQSLSAEKEWLLKEQEYLRRIKELEATVASLQAQLGQTDSPPNR